MQRNSFTRFFKDAGYVRGLITFSGGVPAVGSLSGDAHDRACVSITDTATGIVTMAITNFKGPRGICSARATSITGGVLVACSTGTYSNDTATLIFAVTAGDNTLSDTDFNFEAWAY